MIVTMKMKFFNSDEENGVKCGKCGTEFNIDKNKNGCPLCGFGGKIIDKEIEVIVTPTQKYPQQIVEEVNVDLGRFLRVPPPTNLRDGHPFSDEQTKIWGSWLMFNSFFPIKLASRILGWRIKEEGKEYIPLFPLLIDFIFVTKRYNLSYLKGFPEIPSEKIHFEKFLDNLEKESSVSRIVYHFIKTGYNMGFFNVKVIGKSNGSNDPWKEKWQNIEITLTKQGLEFANLPNSVFDNRKGDTLLTSEEKDFLTKYLKEIDKKDYKEYSTLKEIYDLLKQKKRKYQEMLVWFKENKKFQNYIREQSRGNNKKYEKQLQNYAQTFVSTKISLLREMSVVSPKRNDYTVIGELK